MLGANKRHFAKPDVISKTIRGTKRLNKCNKCQQRELLITIAIDFKFDLFSLSECVFDYAFEI